MLKFGNDAVVIPLAPFILLIGLLALEVLIIIMIVKRILDKKK